MLTIKNVYKKFGDKTVLKNISLSVNHGEIAVLLGASGSGKSTLLRILNNLETLDRGKITLNDRPLDITTVNKNHVVGMVFQQFNLFTNLTIEQNITLALKCTQNQTHEHAQKTAHSLLKQYQLFDKKDCYPIQLSGGQKQRVALARTLALKPTIVCLDEPTSALDPLLTTYVADMINNLAKQNYITLIATHDTELVKQINCTIHLMQNGAIIEQGPSKSCIANPDDYPHITAFLRGKKHTKINESE